MLDQAELWRGHQFKNYEARPRDWSDGFNRVTGSPTIAFCNAETALYKGAGAVINSVKKFNTLVYTNASTWSLRELLQIEPRDNLKLYISYHPEYIAVEDFVQNVKILMAKYKTQNLHSPAYPPLRDKLVKAKAEMEASGLHLHIDHKFLGTYKGVFFPSYLGDDPKFRRRFKQEKTRSVLCKTSFNHKSTLSRAYTIAPDGDFYLCWRYLYSRDERGVIGNFFDRTFEFEDKYYPCDYYGDCHVCAWHKSIIDPETGERLDDDVLA